MKYLIDEKRLNKVIYKYIDDVLGNIDIKYTHPSTSNDPLHKNILFYKLNSNSDEENVFYWYSPDYFEENPKNFKLPMVEVENEYKNELTSFFGTLWHKPFMKWFKNKFNLDIKSVR